MRSAEYLSGRGPVQSPELQQLLLPSLCCTPWSKYSTGKWSSCTRKCSLHNSEKYMHNVVLLPAPGFSRREQERSRQHQLVQHTWQTLRGCPKKPEKRLSIEEIRSASGATADPLLAVMRRRWRVLTAQRACRATKTSQCEMAPQGFSDAM